MCRRGPQQVEDDDGDADRDRRVGDVERPEVPVAPVHVHEVHDVALAQAIDEVARGAADHGHQAGACEPVLGRQVRRVGGDADEGDERHERYHERLTWEIHSV